MKKILLVLLLGVSLYGSSLKEEACIASGKTYLQALNSHLEALHSKDDILILNSYSLLEKRYLDVLTFCKGKENEEFNAGIVKYHKKIMKYKE